MQVLGAVQIAVGVIAFLSVIAILAVLLARGEKAGYSVVIAMVILVSTVPVGEPLRTTVLPNRSVLQSNELQVDCIIAENS